MKLKNKIKSPKREIYRCPKCGKKCLDVEVCCMELNEKNQLVPIPLELVE